MHAFSLEAGRTCQAVSNYCASFSSGTSDFGVEFSLSTVCGLPAHEVLPWFAAAVAEHEGVQEDGGFEAVPGNHVQSADATAMLSLEHMLAVPGILHIVHNASNDLLEHLRVLGP
eukprot:6804419-Alexandrium_andersonii.AAC.1